MRYYYSAGPNSDPIFSPYGLVVRIPSQEGCLEEQEGPCRDCGRLSAGQVALYSNILNELDPVFNTMKATYFSHLDGGNTSNLRDQLNNAQNWNEGFENAQAISPYLIKS